MARRKMVKRSAPAASVGLSRVVTEVVPSPEDEYGRMPGEARGRGQEPERVEAMRMAAVNAEAGGDVDVGETVKMVRGDITLDVGERDVEAHRRQGFVTRDEVKAAEVADE